MSTVTRYGVPHEDVIPLNTRKRILMPIWAENNNNEIVFAGWFVPKEVMVVTANATLEPGPIKNYPLPTLPSHTASEYFDVVFDTPGLVELRCIFTDDVVTADVVQSFRVGEE